MQAILSIPAGHPADRSARESEHDCLCSAFSLPTEVATDFHDTTQVPMVAWGTALDQPAVDDHTDHFSTGGMEVLSSHLAAAQTCPVWPEPFEGEKRFAF